MRLSPHKNCPLSIVHRPLAGFTLVELVAMAALIALLTTVTFMTYAKTWRQWMLRQNAQQFYLAARYGRVLAIESRRPCQLVIDQEKGAFYVVQEGDEPGQQTVVSNLWHHSVTLAESVKFEQVMTYSLQAADATEGAITFRPDGSADAVSVQLGNGARSYTVQISAATARAKLLEGAMDQYEPDRIDLDEML